MNNFYLLLALATGAGVAVMAVFNARLGGLLGGPFWAATAQFSVALSVVLAVAFATRQPAPITTGLGGAPWWVWTGGGVLVAGGAGTAAALVLTGGEDTPTGTIVVGPMP